MTWCLAKTQQKRQQVLIHLFVRADSNLFAEDLTHVVNVFQNQIQGLKGLQLSQKQITFYFQVFSCFLLCLTSQNRQFHEVIFLPVFPMCLIQYYENSKIFIVKAMFFSSTSSNVNGLIVADSLQSCGLQPTRLLNLSDSSGKNTGVGCTQMSELDHKEG